MLEFPFESWVRTYEFDDSEVNRELCALIDSRLATTTDVWGLAYNVQAKNTGQMGDLDHSDPRWREFFTFMNRSLEEWVQHRLGGRTPYQYHYQALWGVRYAEGDWARPHRHGASCISFAYYPYSDAGSSALTFDDWGQSIETVTGRLIMFPGWASHSMAEFRPQRAQSHRWVLAGNIIVI